MDCCTSCFQKIFLSLLVLTLGVGEAEALTLDEAQRAALVHSEELSIAELQTVIAAEKIREIRGINYPKVMADGSYGIRNNHLGTERKNPTYTHRPSSPMMPGMPSPPPQPKNIKTIVANRHTAQGKLSLIVPLYDFGYVAHLEGAQKAIVEETAQERERIRQELLFAVAVDVYRALEGAKLEAVAVESIRLLEAQLATAQDLYAVGLVTHNDVLVVEVQLAERQQELIQVRHAIETILCSLTRLTGRPLLSAEQIDDVSESVCWQESVESAMAYAETNHPLLKKIQASMAAAVCDLQATQAENDPDINGFVNLHGCSDSYLLHKNWIHGGISIDIPIFDGGIVNSKVSQRQKEISALDLRYQQAMEDIRLDIQSSFLRADSAFHRIPVAQKSIQLAKENLAISQDLFEEGLIMSDDVLNDESRLAMSRSNYYQALYGFYIAKSELERAAGRIEAGIG